MGPSGAVSFLQWSNLTYENGEKIRSKNNDAIIDYLQSEDKPIVIEQFEDRKQEDISKEENQYQDRKNTNYYYFIIPIVIIVGFLLYRFLHKRSAP